MPDSDLEKIGGSARRGSAPAPPRSGGPPETEEAPQGNEPSAPGAPAPERRVVVFSFKGTPEFDEWFERLKAHAGLEKDAQLMEEAIRLYAVKLKFKEPMPDRMFRRNRRRVEV